ncbi:glycosyl hydrolase [Gryllotalpicola daejeonensis]|uniref:Glycosyl hydrolase n=1 Tax=Gryllotalpicola daejeonensis TaxID=993087 RepID=A0ABP7ZIA4_9MICO
MSAATPSDANATPETRALHSRLRELTGIRTLFGHQDDLAYGGIERHVRRLPGVVGFDLGGIEALAGHNLDGVPFQSMIRWVREAHAKGALVTLSWHSVNPITNGGYGHNTAPMSIASVLRNGECHEKFLRWLEHVAMFIEQLTDASGRPIPVIFRPFHEHSGDWFWWGIGAKPDQQPQNSPEEFVALWRFTVDYLRDVAGLHNLLYAISPDRSRLRLDALEDDYLRGYPGDEFVDILGIDNYWDAGRADDDRTSDELFDGYVATLEAVARVGEARDKLVAQTETGTPGERVGHADDPWTGFLARAAEHSALTRKHLWHLVWRDEVEAPDDLARLVGHPLIAFAGDVDDIYGAHQ